MVFFFFWLVGWWPVFDKQNLQMTNKSKDIVSEKLPRTLGNSRNENMFSGFWGGSCFYLEGKISRPEIFLGIALVDQNCFQGVDLQLVWHTQHGLMGEVPCSPMRVGGWAIMILQLKTSWWFQIIYIFTPIWRRFPF